MFTVPPGNKFETAEDIAVHLKGLDAGETEVEFRGSSYSAEACAAIAKALAAVEGLKVANLDDMFTGRDGPDIAQGLDDILKVLVGKHELHTINLSDNAFGIAALIPLENFLSQHEPLQHLYFANNGFGPQAGARIGHALEKLAERRKSANSSVKLLTVVCGRNRLETGSMAAWARFIKAHGTIEELRLYQNGIRPEGIEILFRDGLAYAPHLRKLDLQDNTFTLKGSQALAKVIDKWPQLHELGISDCLLSAKGARVLAQAIHDDAQGLKNLEILRLQFNEIDERGLRVLYDAVKKNVPKLKLLELNGNRFSEDHDYIEQLNVLFGERGHGELDELDEMEEPSDDEEDEADESEDEDADDKDRIETALKAGARDADFNEEGPGVEEETDDEVDGLAKEVADTKLS